MESERESVSATDFSPSGRGAQVSQIIGLVALGIQSDGYAVCLPCSGPTKPNVHRLPSDVYLGNRNHLPRRSTRDLRGVARHLLRILSNDMCYNDVDCIPVIAATVLRLMIIKVWPQIPPANTHFSSNSDCPRTMLAHLCNPMLVFPGAERSSGLTC